VPKDTSGLDRVLRDRGANRWGIGFGMLTALVGHAAVAWLLPAPAEAHSLRPRVQQTIELEPLPKEAVAEEPVHAPEKPREPQAYTPHAVAPQTKAAAPSPAPARAAAVVTQERDDPADFSNSIVVGAAESYAGGQSASLGSVSHRVGAVDRAVHRGTAPAARTPSAAGASRAKRARLAGGASWDCPFPEGANAGQVDHAVVTLRVAVGQNGATRSVSVDVDPGNGFGQEARVCALRKQFEPATDPEGNPIEGTTLINVRFDR
jgi:periplasmic protein TonB